VKEPLSTIITKDRSRSGSMPGGRPNMGCIIKDDDAGRQHNSFY
jgi:hypothetical protein